MNKNVIIRTLAALVFIGILFSGCDIIKQKLTIAERLDSFAAHLTSDRPNINSDFRIGTTGYASADTYVAAYEAGTYSISGLVIVGTSVSGNIVCTDIGFGTRTFTATMDYDSNGSAVIVSISITGKVAIPA